jgi:hypothetical protein
MKKIITILFILMLLSTLTGCTETKIEKEDAYYQNVDIPQSKLSFVEELSELWERMDASISCSCVQANALKIIAFLLSYLIINFNIVIGEN